jgi:hypothetical protein
MMEQTLVDNATDEETDTRLFIPDVETDPRQLDSIHIWHVLVCLVIGVFEIIGNCYLHSYISVNILQLFKVLNWL